jgi:hypothetical protein
MKISKAALMSAAEKKRADIEFSSGYAREIGDTKWVRWATMYQRLQQRKFRKNDPEGK